MLDKLVDRLDSQYFPPRGVTLIVAVSGGVDSVVLLHILLLLSHQYDWQLVVAHFNHQLRKTAGNDAEFVANLAKNLGLRYVSGTKNVMHLAKGRKLTIEEAARLARYDFLCKVAKKFRATAVVTGHTADDQVETVIMNWLRGGGVRALAGMRVREGMIWRPLLPISKSELQKFAKDYGLKYREDRSNRSVKFTRNLIRQRITPELRKVNPIIEEVMLRNASILSELEDFINQIVVDAYKKIARESRGVVWLKSKEFFKLHPFIQSELLLYTIGQIKGDRQDIKQVHLREAHKVIASGKSKAWGQLPGKLFVSQGYGKIGFSRQRPKFIH